jgi:uncharacterized protein (DUF362 family)
VSLDSGRRRFLKALIIGGGAAAASRVLPAGPADPPPAPLPGPQPSPASAPARPIVYRARREGLASDKGLIDAARLNDALGSAIARSLGEGKPVDALRRTFRSSDVVGIKVNTIAGRKLSPHPELVLLIAGWLQEAGVPARNILIWDRTDQELVKAGFTLNRSGSGVRIFGTNEDYDWKPREWGPNGSCFSKALVSEMTALINVGVLKDHELAGVAGGMKNWYGAIQNPNKCHEDGCHPYVAHLAAYPLIRDKLRLTVIDGITAQCNAGPAYSPRWAWPWQGLLASTDPVALDTVAMKVIEDRRKELNLPSLADEKRAPKWLAEAGKLGLGEADPTRIRVEDV